MNKTIKKIKMLLAAVMLSVTVPAAATDYNLAPSIQEGVILHCFNWTYSQITNSLEDIAKAGFTTVQTSPAQYPTSTTGAWYWLYQPLGFYLSDSGPLGTADELAALCTKAHELGMFVIVDVVANHLCGTHTHIQDDLKDSQYWHTYGSSIDYSNRYAITHGDIGMQDLATENSYVQSCVVSYLKTLLDLGVDGFRWDAAKHIDLPSEWNSQFWPAVTTNLGAKTKLGNEPYHYGEILDNPVTGDNSLFGEYANYIDFTDNTYGNNVLSSFNGSSAYDYYGNLTTYDYVNDDNVVYWAESHDTYSNDGGSSKSVDTNIVDRAWAVVASRNNIPALYLSRPSSTENSSITIGEKGSTHFTSAEVAAVNHFHNAANGNPDYFVCENNVNAVCRANGAVIVLGSGSNTSVSVTNGEGYTAAGTYTDEISGNTFTVTSSTISGTVGSTGIAVIYKTMPKITLDPASCTFSTETLAITATLEDGTSGTITVGSTTYTLSESNSTATFTIGSDMDYGESITVSWIATSSDETTATGSETYKKEEVTYYLACDANDWLGTAASSDDDSSSGITVYVNSSSAYYYMYAWNGSNKPLGSWPGTQLSKLSTKTVNGKTYYYSTFSDVDTINVIFNTGDGGSQTGDIKDIASDAYFTYSGGTSYSKDIVCDALDTKADSVTVWCKASSSAYYMYAWDSDDTKLLGEWPGTQFSSLETKTYKGSTYYGYTFKTAPVNVIFNTGSDGYQSGDIIGLQGGEYYFFYSGNTSVSLAATSTTASYSDYAFTSASDGTLVLQLAPTLFGTTKGFTVYGDDGYEYSYGGSVNFNTEYTYAYGESDTTYLSTSSSSASVSFVITSASAGTSVVMKVVDENYEDGSLYIFGTAVDSSDGSTTSSNWSDANAFKLTYDSDGGYYYYAGSDATETVIPMTAGGKFAFVTDMDFSKGYYTEDDNVPPTLIDDSGKSTETTAYSANTDGGFYETQYVNILGDKQTADDAGYSDNIGTVTWGLPSGNYYIRLYTDATVGDDSENLYTVRRSYRLLRPYANEVTVDDAKYTTFKVFCDYNAVVVPEDVTVLYVPEITEALKTSDDTSSDYTTYELELEALDFGNNARVLPANTPVILAMTTERKNSDSSTLEADTITMDYYSDPASTLNAVTTAMTPSIPYEQLRGGYYDSDNDCYNFIFGYKKLNNTDEKSTIGFYYATGGYSAINGAYLSLSSSYLTSSSDTSGEETAKETALVFFNDLNGTDNYTGESETTGISNALDAGDADADGAYYTLYGIRISKPTVKGIYIHNGKKTVVK